MKKLFPILCLALLCSLTGARAANPVLTVGTAKAGLDEDVSVAVTASGLSNFSSFALKIKFDDDKMKLTKVSRGTATQGWVYLDGQAHGDKVQVIGRSSMGRAISGDDQQLFTMTFHTQKDAYNTTESLTPESPDWDLKRASLIPGSVAISGNPPMKLSIGKTSAAGMGDTTATTGKVLVTVNWLTGSTGWSFDLTYDTKRLSFAKVVTGSATKGWTMASKSIKNGVRITGTAGKAASGIDLQLCTISLTVKPGLTASDLKKEKSIKLHLSKPTLGLNGAKTSDGKFVINKYAPTPTPRPTPTPTVTPTPTSVPTPTPGVKKK